MTDLLRHLTLSNGLTLTLRHAPRLKRAAAALRVHAGSHDAPRAWPGLAHFLEHLFFLGTDGLMGFVQSAGGQVNASTRERTTDFFFELPPALLPGGLERLCHMLIEPDLDNARQQAEREVIHSEFIAWSRSREAQQQFALLQRVSPRHPLSGFHAGNRFTLALHAPAFQRALRDFHTVFYTGGQISLSLCGPQPLDELEAIGRQFAAGFRTGQRVPQKPPPALLEAPLPTAAIDNGRLELLFALEQLPDGTDQALDLLTACLSDSRPGSWLATARERGWLRGFHSEPLYSFAGQLLLSIRLHLNDKASAAGIEALLHSWLGHLREADLTPLNDEFSRLQRSRELAASALELARRDSASQPFSALDAAALKAFRTLLDALPGDEAGDWQALPPEPLLLTELPDATAPLPQDISLSDCLPESRQFAAVYLRWSGGAYSANHTVQPLIERAQRASVQLDFSATADHCHLRCAGAPASVIRTVGLALAQLRKPEQPTEHLPTPLIPIRALLKALPDTLRAPVSRTALASRHGLAIGFGEAEQAALGAVLDVLPHQAPLPPASASGLRRWAQVDTGGSEHALLLFCPLPAALEGPGRLLAQSLQGPVYQRLRVELQLGYAVFSTFRQIEGRGGLLFGVQSAHATPAQVLDHLQTLFAEGVSLDPVSRQTLADSFQETTLPNHDIAERAWQTYLATEPSDLDTLRRTILSTGQSQLDTLLQHLLTAEHGWFCLANAAAPTAQWH